MLNTMKPDIQDVKISVLLDIAIADANFMAVLSTTTGDFSLVLQVRSEDVLRSTGMVTVPSGIVTASDVGRVLEAASSLLCKGDVVMHALPECSFVVNNKLHTELMPIGMPATRLDVTVTLARIPAGMLRRWCACANALGRHVIGWRTEVIFY